MKREVGIEEMIECAYKLGAEQMLKNISQCVDANGNIHPRVGRELARYAVGEITIRELESMYDTSIEL